MTVVMLNSRLLFKEVPISSILYSQVANKRGGGLLLIFRNFVDLISTFFEIIEYVIFYGCADELCID